MFENLIVLKHLFASLNNIKQAHKTLKNIHETPTLHFAYFTIDNPFILRRKFRLQYWTSNW